MERGSYTPEEENAPHPRGAFSYLHYIQYYSVTGGVPKYIELFSNSQDIYSAIDRNVLSKQSFLYEEPNFLLQNEVSEIGSYFSIIKAIAAGHEKLGNIATVLELKSTGLTKYLKTLIDLDILERQVPVTEENPEKSKKGLYRITDNFIEFWFKYIYPNRQFIETDNSAFVLNKIKTHWISRHVACVYEDICREKMWELNAKGHRSGHPLRGMQVYEGAHGHRHFLYSVGKEKGGYLEQR